MPTVVTEPYLPIAFLVLLCLLPTHSGLCWRWLLLSRELPMDVFPLLCLVATPPEFAIGKNECFYSECKQVPTSGRLKQCLS